MFIEASQVAVHVKSQNEIACCYKMKFDEISLDDSFKIMTTSLTEVSGGTVKDRRNLSEIAIVQNDAIACQSSLQQGGREIKAKQQALSLRFFSSYFSTGLWT